MEANSLRNVLNNSIKRNWDTTESLMVLGQIKHWFWVTFTATCCCSTLNSHSFYWHMLYKQPTHTALQHRFKRDKLASHAFLCSSFWVCCLFMCLTLFTHSLSFSHTDTHTNHRTIVSLSDELLHCGIARALPLQIQLLDNLSQLQYEGKWLTSIIYISQPPSLSLPVILGAELCTRAQCPGRPSLNWLNSLSQDPCTSSSSHGEDTCSKQLLHIPDGRARQMSKENQRERQGKVYEPALANLNEQLFIPSSKTGCSWRNSRPLSCLEAPLIPALPLKATTLWHHKSSCFEESVIIKLTPTSS